MGLITSAANRKIVVPTSSSLNSLTGFTVAGWYFVTERASDDTFCYRLNAAASSVYRVLLSGTTGDIQFAVWRAGGTAFVVTDDQPVLLNTWCYIAATFEDTGELSVYHGSLTSDVVESTYGTNNQLSGVLDEHDGDLIICNNITNQGNRFLNATTAEFQHYNRLLTLPELIKEQRGNRPHPDLVIDMQMGWNVVGTTQPDRSQFKNDGVITGETQSFHIPLNRAMGMDAGKYISAITGPAFSLSGTAAGSTVVTGNIDITKVLAGQADGSTVVTGNIDITKSLAGQADGSTTSTGAIDITKALSGQADGSTTTTGAIDITKALSGQADGSTVVTGNIELAGSFSLSGTAAGSTTVVGAIDITKALAGQADGQTTVAGAIDITKSLAGQADGSTVIAGAIDITKALSGQADGSTVVTGNIELSGALDLAGTAAGSTVMTGTMTLSGPLAGQADGSTVVTGNLTQTSEFSLSGTASGTSTASGSIDITKSLAGTAVGQAVAAGSISITKALSGQADGSTVVTGNLGFDLVLSGTAAGSTVMTGNLTSPTSILLGAQELTVLGVSDGRTVAGTADEFTVISGG
ncbi:MAG: hypothetical protein COA47_10430 [Robiginitomaculum sp.]|nr:MAG: hypothetical protein COA47_10430 [Robiginitomaculum sp.]